MIQSIDSCKQNGLSVGKETLLKTWHKFASIFAYILISVILKYTILNYIFGLKYSTLSEELYGFVSEVLLLHVYVPIENINSPLWYLSSLLTVFPILYYIVKKYRDFWASFFCIVAALYIYSFMLFTYGTFGVVFEDCIFFKVAIIRTFAGLCVGIICYEINKNLSVKIKENVSLRLTLIEWGTIILVFKMMTTLSFSKTKYDLYIIILIGVLVTIIFSQKTYTYVFLNKIKTPLTGKFSLALFVSHMEYAIHIDKILPDRPTSQRMGTYFFLVILTAMLVMFLANILTKILSRNTIF